MCNDSWQRGQDVGLTYGAGPNAPATRQEMMVFLQRFSDLCTGSDVAIIGEDLGLGALVINVIINRINNPVFPKHGAGCGVCTKSVCTDYQRRI